MEHLTYQQVLADHYEETAKTVLVVAHEYEEEVPPHEKNPKEELEDQEDFQKFTPRHDPEMMPKPPVHEDKTKLSVLYDKQTQVRLINIDSRYRNRYGNSLTPIFEKDVFIGNKLFLNYALNTSSSDFIFKLKEPIKNVISVRLSSIEIPNSFYTFSQARGNVQFQITYPSASLNVPGTKTYTLEIPAGNWDSSVYDAVGNSASASSPPYDINSFSSVLWKVAFTLNYFFSLSLSAPPGYETFIGERPLVSPGALRYNQFELSLNPANGKVNIKFNKTIQGTAQIIQNVPYDIDWIVPPNTVADNYVSSTWLQPPINPVYSSAQIRNSSTSVSDFGLGYNLGYRLPAYYPSQVLLGGLSSQYYAEAIINTVDTNYMFLSLDPDWKVIEQETPDRTQLFAFAKIVVNVPKFDIINDNGANTLTKEYFLKQPTNIHTIPVRISDPYDQDIDLNGLDFSFTLELREVLSSGLYESMRS
jgi:hypothetical protein